MCVVLLTEQKYSSRMKVKKVLFICIYFYFLKYKI